MAVILTFFAFSGFILGLLIFYDYYDELSLTDLALASLFVAFIFSTNYISMILPSIIYYVIPAGAGFTFYLPASIFYGTFKSLSSAKSSSFIVLIGYGIVSEIFFPAIFWFPYFLAWSGFVESHSHVTSFDVKKQRYLHGFIFGAYGAGLAVLYMLVAWGLYKPLFIALPAVIIDGILSAIGFEIGFNIGKQIKNVQI